MKAIGVLNFGSLLLLVAALEIHERTNYLISHSTANVEIAVLGCGVVTVYFQDSFIQSVFLWVCLIGMSCYVTLFTAHNLVGADFGELVSCCCSCCCGYCCVALAVIVAVASVVVFVVVVINVFLKGAKVLGLWHLGVVLGCSIEC